MTLTDATVPAVGGVAEDKHAAEVWAAIEPEFLTILGWDDERRTLAFPTGHPLLGWDMCRVSGCHQAVRNTPNLCASCGKRWKASKNVSLDAFLAAPKPRLRCIGVGVCAVDGCQRPWKAATTRLCIAHSYQQEVVFQIPLEQFLAHPDVTPLASFGPCSVRSCVRDRVGKGPYCHQHQQRHYRLSKDPDFDVERWHLTASAIAIGSEVSLRGLPDRVVAEVVYGIQQRVKDDIKTRYWVVRPVCDALRATEAQAAEHLPDDALTSRPTREFFKSTVRALRRRTMTPDSERHKDVWDLYAFGHSGHLAFTEITQPWLREAAKQWAYNDLPKRRGRGAGGVTRTHINGVARLSESLWLQRADLGDNVTALGRQDITAFLNRMAFLHDQGKISAHTRLRQCREVRLVLAGMRSLGLREPGKSLHRLPDDFTLTRDDMPDEPEDSEAGKDLPSEVMRHLCAHLDTLEELTSRESRVAVELMIDTGRRPHEIAQLGLDSLERDPDGEPVLVYDNHKANRKARRLPIPKATAAVIVAQQERVRARFPDTPTSELRLLPAATRNPGGRRAVSDDWISMRHRTWVDSLPDVQVPTVIEQDGQHVTKMLPFDKAKIFPYAYRHTFAQRHADAGVDVTVLKELLDHRLLETTQRYFNVGQERRREAVDRVTTMQFDRHGNRVWRQAKALLDSEHARRAVGEVAVPYGGCSEPSNVAAGGQDCPVRFRCIGCGHFSTDISYLPDLERYLADLLRHRERLAATVDADEWAKTEAMPSDNEIKRIRRLNDRMNGDLDDLSDEDRAQIDEAVAVVRRGRAKVVALGIPRVRQPLPDIRPERSA